MPAFSVFPQCPDVAILFQSVGWGEGFSNPNFSTMLRFAHAHPTLPAGDAVLCAQFVCVALPLSAVVRPATPTIRYCSLFLVLLSGHRARERAPTPLRFESREFWKSC